MANVARVMESSKSLSGLMKWLAKDPWRDGFLDVLDRHIGKALDEQDIPDFDELGGLIDLHWAMTVFAMKRPELCGEGPRCAIERHSEVLNWLARISSRDNIGSAGYG